MGNMIELTAADGHRLQAYRADALGEPMGGLVMIQEIFGLTNQMKRCADRYADVGYTVVMPAMFDRVERGLVCTYDQPQEGGGAARSVTDEQIYADIAAARESAADAGKVGIIGYCWGGTIAYMGASTGDFACAVSYYGGGIGGIVDEIQPKVPVLYHFGAEDKFIPEETRNRILEADPSAEICVYEGAEHGFNCDDRASYHDASSLRSEERTLKFLSEQL